MKGIQRFKPASSRRSRLLLASLMWTGVGIGLAVAGVRWLALSEAPGTAAGLGAALVIGWAKGRFLLTRRASANADRIDGAGEGRCLGGVFSWATWGLVLVMVGLGRTLRYLPIADFWLGLIYAAAGFALLFASAVSWRRWHRMSTAEPACGADSGPA